MSSSSSSSSWSSPAPASPARIVTVGPLGPFGNMCYGVLDTTARAGLLVDASFEAARAVEAVRTAAEDAAGGPWEWSVVFTHGHVDHVAGAADAARMLQPAPNLLMHAADEFLYSDVTMQIRHLGGAGLPGADALLSAGAPPKIDRFLADGDVVLVGAHALEVLHTPGHSPGSICLLLRDSAAQKIVVFSGDVLFAGSVGRTDLWGGSEALLRESIAKRLLPLPDAAVVLPGHGPATTIGAERRSNPFIRCA